MLPIIDRYLLREVSKAFLAIITLLLLILVGSGYIRFLGQAAVGNIGSDVMLKLVAVEAVRVLGPITPPAFFLAVLLTLGRMYRDSEMIAMAASGIGPLRIYRALFLAALPVALLVLGLTLQLQPWANGAKKSIFKQQEEKLNLGTGVVGRFNEFSRGNLVFYVEGMSEDNKRLQNIFVQNRKHGKLGITVAAEGYQYLDEETGERFVVLLDGHRYEGQPGSKVFTYGKFGKYALRINLGRGERTRQRTDALPTSRLIGSDRLQDRIELQYRLMLPLAVLVFTVVSVPLSYSLPRSGIYGRLILAILFYFLFVNLLAVSGGWMESGITPEWMGRWWVHLLMLSLAGLLILYRSPFLRRRLRRQLRRRPT